MKSNFGTGGDASSATRLCCDISNNNDNNNDNEDNSKKVTLRLDNRAGQYKYVTVAVKLHDGQETKLVDVASCDERAGPSERREGSRKRDTLTLSNTTQLPLQPQAPVEDDDGLCHCNWFKYDSVQEDDGAFSGEKEDFCDCPEYSPEQPTEFSPDAEKSENYGINNWFFVANNTPTSPVSDSTSQQLPGEEEENTSRPSRRKTLFRFNNFSSSPPASDSASSQPPGQQEDYAPYPPPRRTPVRFNDFLSSKKAPRRASQGSAQPPRAVAPRRRALRGSVHKLNDGRVQMKTCRPGCRSKDGDTHRSTPSSHSS
ncbi:hypothetical protein LSAT2_027994 [Lamellibrachia satsuma]|nr:hypothetical protein LSAT2_027994 [Lamellibrachia satsuma]